MSITLKTVEDVIYKNIEERTVNDYYIPDYQRGYKWDTLQVQELLEDLRDYALKIQAIKFDGKKYEKYKEVDDIDDKEIYCIQPLVVRINGEKWNVVDGQQRLTTIFLILKYLGQTDLYSIDYQTRTDSKLFLESIAGKGEDDKTNVDYYHFVENWKHINDWFKSSEKNCEIKDVLKNIILKRVNFIWYEINEGEDEIDVFNRLNIGRIPLTDGELIKALFLNESVLKDGELQQRIAMEWDEIEFKLQNDEFWLFIHNTGYDIPTRIDYIFELVEEIDVLKVKKDLSKILGDHVLFQYFNYAFKTEFKNYDKSVALKDAVLLVWEEIKLVFSTIEEWYQNQELFHYIGYLVTVSEKDLVCEFLKSWRSTDRTNFIGSAWDLESVKGRIYERLVAIQSDMTENGENYLSLEKFKYDEDESNINKVNGKAVKVAKADCKPILLLHNVETIVQQNKQLVAETKYNLPNFTKFPFHLYKRDRWDVEHIRPNSGDRIAKLSDKKIYLEISKNYLNGEDDLKREIDTFLNQNIWTKEAFKEEQNEMFSKLRKKIDDAFEAVEYDDRNKIWNYTLLDKTTNIQYSNYIFPIKRAFVFAKEQGYKLDLSSDDLAPSGERQIAFVPVCTRNIFAKYYSTKPENLNAWTKYDAECYLDNMKLILKEYLDKAEAEMKVADIKRDVIYLIEESLKDGTDTSVKITTRIENGIKSIFEEISIDYIACVKAMIIERISEFKKTRIKKEEDTQVVKSLEDITNKIISFIEDFELETSVGDVNE